MPPEVIVGAGCRALEATATFDPPLTLERHRGTITLAGAFACYGAGSGCFGGVLLCAQAPAGCADPLPCDGHPLGCQAPAACVGTAHVGHGTLDPVPYDGDCVTATFGSANQGQLLGGVLGLGAAANPSQGLPPTGVAYAGVVLVLVPDAPCAEATAEVVLFNYFADVP